MNIIPQVQLALTKKGYAKFKDLFKNKFPDEHLVMETMTSTEFSKNNNIDVFLFDAFTPWDIKLENLLIDLHKQGYGYNLVKTDKYLSDCFEDICYGSLDAEKFNKICLSISITAIKDNEGLLK